MSWITVPLRQLITPASTRNRSDLPLLSVVRDKGVIMRELDKRDNHNTIPEDLSNYKVVLSGQFVINKMKAWQGSCGVSFYDGIVSPAYYVFDLNIDNPCFFNYAIRSRHFVDEFGRVSKGIRVDQWDLPINELKNIPFSLPPRPVQDQIVRYLDWKVSGINRLINAKKKQIELLAEMERAVVSSMLCGEKVWLKRLVITFFQYGANDAGCEYSEDLPRYIRITDITPDGRLKSEGAKSLSADIAKPYILEHGDILLARSGATAGKAFMFKAKYGLSAFAGYLIRAKLNKQHILPEFFMYFTDSNDYFQWKNSIFIQATIQNISAERYSQLPVPIPPRDKQQKIVAYLDDKCSAIDNLTEKIITEISLLGEYKTRLISDVVTGKLDVSGVIVPVFDGATDDTESGLEDYSRLT